MSPDLSNLGNLFSGVRFWLPMVSAFVMVFSGFRSIKKNVTSWVEALLNNHLAHIETATVNTHLETQRTNALLVAAAMQDVAVAAKVTDVKTTVDLNQQKAETVWEGIVKTLVILEDRSRAVSRTPRRR